MMIHIFSMCLLGCQAPHNAKPAGSHPLSSHNRIADTLPIKTASPISHASLPVATGSYQVQGDNQQHRLVARSPQYGSYDDRGPRGPYGAGSPASGPYRDGPYRDGPYRDGRPRDRPYREERGYRGDSPRGPGGGGPYRNGFDDERESREARQERQARRERAREREMRESQRDRDRNYRGATIIGPAGPVGVVPYRPTYPVVVTPRTTIVVPRPTYPVVVPRPTYPVVVSPRPVYPLTQIVPTQPRTVYSVRPRPVPIPVTTLRPVTVTVPRAPITVNVPRPVVTVSVSANPVTVTQVAPDGSGLETIDSEVQCREFPDLVSTQWTNAAKIPRRSKVNVDCWTNSPMPGALGGQGNSNVWLHVTGGSGGASSCWLHEKSFARFGDLRALPFCQAPPHRVAALQPQYAKLDYCYDRPSLDAPSKPLGSDRFVDVVCHVFAENVRGNRTWVKALRGCYFPGEMFDTAGWFGTGLPNC